MHHDIHSKRVFVLPYQMFCGGCSDHHQRFLSSLGSNETVVFCFGNNNTSLNTSLNKSSEEWTEKNRFCYNFCYCSQGFDLLLIPLPRSVLVIVISIGILIVLTQSGQGLLFCSNFLSVGCRDWVVRQMVVIQAPLKMSVFFLKTLGTFQFVNFTYKRKG